MTGLIGQTIGNYRIEELLGSGGMGQVFRGAHRHLDRMAAIKIMHAHLAIDPGFQARFVREARAAAALNHPHIVEIYDFGEQDGRLYLVMELMPDGSLATLLRDGTGGAPPDWRRGVALVRQAAEGLAYAHQHGMVHRDIKPDNLLLRRAGGPSGADVLKICDFGLARLAEGSGTTSTGLMMGTPAYMSPEQCQGAEMDSRSDQYSLGVVLFEAVTGQRPFEARTPTEAIFKHVYGEPPTPRSARPDLPAELDAIIMRCLTKRSVDRYATTDELVAALRDVEARLGGPAATARPTAPQGSSDADAATLVGGQLQRYHVEAALPPGGSTWNYLGQHSVLQRRVVLRVLRPDLADPATVERFGAAARAAALIRHANLIEVFDTGVEQGRYFAAVDDVRGATLRDVLRAGRPTADEALARLSQVADALDHAHAHGIEHRDVRPENIVVSADGTPVLLDIGDIGLAEDIVLAAGSADARTAYLAPERSRGVAANPRADIFALGSLAEELLGGGAAPGGVPPLPSAVAEVIARAHADDPQLRPATAGDLVRALSEAVASTTPIAPAPESLPVAAVAEPDPQRLARSVAETAPALGAAAPPPPSASVARHWSNMWPLALIALALVLAVIGALRWAGGGSSQRTPTSAVAGGGPDGALTPTAAVLPVVADPTQTLYATATEEAPTSTVTEATPAATSTETIPPTATPTATPSPTVAVTPTYDWIAGERSGLIAFVSGRRPDNPNIPDIYVMTPDGSGQRRLLTIAAADAYPSSDPAWSHDGKRMAFTSSRDGNDEIYTMNIDGSNLNNLTQSQAADNTADWSPDDAQIVFQSNRDGNFEIYAMNADGSNAHNLTDNPATDWGPKWSPDGTEIVFVSDRSGTNLIYVMNADGSNPRPLTSDADIQDYNPTWSPDGSLIAFARNAGGTFHIFVMKPDGTEMQQLTNGAAEDGTPTWSPDGKTILFRSMRDGNAEVYVMNADGSDQRRLTDNPTYDGSPVWAPQPR